jgi:N,N'-diacetylchitobiose transport system permease protein
MCAAPLTTETAPASLGPRTGALARRPVTRHRLGNAALPYLLITPAVIVIGVVMAYPMLYLVVLSLQHYGLAQLLAHQGDWVGLQNYQTILSDSLFWQTVARTATFTAVTVAVSMALATVLALLMGRVSSPVKLLLSGGLIFVWATPVVVAIDIWQWMVDFEFGVFNWLLTRLHVGNFVHYNWFENPLQGFTVIAALVVWGALPFLTITLFAGLAQVPDEIVEAARVDGAGPWQVFWQVTVPIVRPLYLILFSLSTIWNFRLFDQIWIMLNARPGSGYYTMGVYSYVKSFKVDQFGLGATIAVLMVLILMVGTFVYIRGLARSGELDR